jgi:hypothetical protein
MTNGLRKLEITHTIRHRPKTSTNFKILISIKFTKYNSLITEKISTIMYLIYIVIIYTFVSYIRGAPQRN